MAAITSTTIIPSETRTNLLKNVDAQPQRLTKVRERLVWANISLIKQIFEFLEEKQRNLLLRKEFIGCVRYPFHTYLDNVAKLQHLFLINQPHQKAKSSSCISERYAGNGRHTPAEDAMIIDSFPALMFFMRHAKNADEFILWFGSYIPLAERTIANANPFYRVENLAFADEIFAILQSKCTSSHHYLSICRYFEDANNHYRHPPVLQKYMPSFALLHPCRMGLVPEVTNAIKDIIESSIPPHPVIVLNALKIAIEHGSTEVLKTLVTHDSVLPVRDLLQRHGSELIDLCIEMGYPELVSLLQTSLSLAQKQALAKLQGDLAVGARRLDIMPARPINKAHGEDRGGSANEVIYQAKYRQGVAYIKHYGDNPNCNFAKLLENLCCYRRHMGNCGGLDRPILGSVLQIDEYIRTPYAHPSHPWIIENYGEQDVNDLENACYLVFGDEIRSRYAGRLPLQVTADIPHYGKVELTQMLETHWNHPTGKDRPAVIRELGRLLDQINRKTYPRGEKGARLLLQDFGYVYWLGALFPIMRNGMPTTLSMLADAMLDKKCGVILEKDALSKMGLELTCKALCWDNPKEFIEHVLLHAPLRESPVARKEVFANVLLFKRIADFLHPFHTAATLSNTDAIFEDLQSKSTCCADYQAIARWFAMADKQYGSPAELQKYMLSFGLLEPCKNGDIYGLLCAIKALDLRDTQAHPTIVLNAVKIAIEHGHISILKLLTSDNSLLSILCMPTILQNAKTCLLDLCKKWKRPEIAMLLAKYGSSSTSLNATDVSSQ